MNLVRSSERSASSGPGSVAALVLILALVATLVATHLHARANQSRAAQAFQAAAGQATQHVYERICLYQYGLRGARGAALGATGGPGDRARFDAYSRSRDIDREFPGARGMGFIRRVARGEEAAFERRAQEDGAPDFHIHEIAPHLHERFVIQYINPVERNLAAVGLDIASEARRRQAALTAMRTGEAILTAPITLVQASGLRLRSFLFLLPVYPGGATPVSERAREAQCVGWTYAPLIIDEVLADLDLQQGGIAVRLRDLEQDEDFFASTPEARLDERFFSSTPLPLYGRTWDVRVEATTSFVPGLNLTPTSTVALVGMSVSLLLSALAFILALSRQRGRMLLVEQARRAEIVQGSHDAIVATDLRGQVTDWNAGAVELFGYDAQSALGRALVELIVPDEGREPFLQRLRASAGGAVTRDVDTVMITAGHRSLEVSLTMSRILGHQAAPIGLSLFMRDVGEARRAAREIRELNETLEGQVRERTAMLESARHDLEMILDAVPSAIGYWNADLVNRVANRAQAVFAQVEAQTVVGRNMLELLGAEAYAEFLPHVQAVLSGEVRHFQRSTESADGRERHSMVHLIPDIADGQTRGFYTIEHDVTDLVTSRLARAAAQRENEALLRTIHRHALVSITDRAGRIIEVNDNFCAVSGFARAELVGSNHRIINSGLHDASFWTEMWSTVSRGESWRGTVGNRRKDGSVYWVDSTIAPFFDEQGRVERYISIRTDITGVKQAEEKVRASKAILSKANERFAFASAAAGIGVWEWDVGANRIAWDDQMFKLYGQERLQVEAGDLFDVWIRCLHPDDRVLAEKEVRAAAEGGDFDVEFRIIRPDGETRYIKAMAQALIEGDGSGGRRLIGVNLDITKKKEAELSLRETSSLLTSVLAAASEVSIIATDPELNITVFNAGAERLLGYASVEMVGKETPMRLHDAREIEARIVEFSEALGRPIEGGAVFTDPELLRQPREWTYIQKDGNRVEVSLVVTAMKGEKGEVFGYLGVAHDRTQQIAIEHTLRHAVREAKTASLAKSQFLANMSHEIRTPMNAVIGLSYLLGQTELKPDQASYLQKMDLASNSLRALIDDVLDLSKIEAGELEIERAPFDVGSLVQEMAEMMRVHSDAKGILFQIEVAEAVPGNLDGDAHRLRQILNNLLSNAIKFTLHGGVQLRVSTVSTSAEEVRIRFAVRDSGIGIPVEHQDRLFEPFAQADTSTTRKFGGTGLGLSIVRRLVELMGGTLGLASAPNLGSEFWVEIPFGHGHEQPTQSRKKFSPNTLQGVRVLVVDDSEINLEVARRTLELAGATVVLAEDGLEAVGLLRGDPTRFDVVLMDVQMPQMDGREATRRIRGELGLSLPIIALSAGALASEFELARSAGMDDFLSKPFVPQALVETIGRWASRTGPQPARSLSPGEGDGPSIDRRAAVHRLGGDAQYHAELLERFRVSLLSPSVSAEDPEQLAAWCHKLKGSAGMLGVISVQLAAARLGEACHRGEAVDIATRFVALREEIDAFTTSEEPDTASAPSCSESIPLGTVPSEQLIASMRELRTALVERRFGALTAFRLLAPELSRVIEAPLLHQLGDDISALRFDAAELTLAQHLPWAVH